MKDPVVREILLALWKIHILHHAAEGPVYGLWMLDELAEHGYRLSPGTLYPVLRRMEQRGWLKGESEAPPRGRRNYRITPEGRKILSQLRRQIAELHDELSKVKPAPRSIKSAKSKK